METQSQETHISFTVSARTARLIGRENIATAKGAIIELVKNGYDADSKVSIVYFDNKYSGINKEVSAAFRSDLLGKGLDEGLFDEVYEKKEESYFIREGISEERILFLKNTASKFNSLYLIDFGEGMTKNIIVNHWMTIGTDNKATDYLTKKGNRVKAGAKGIGRFALDKLGGRCEMITIFNPSVQGQVTNNLNEEEQSGIYTGYNWLVNWEDFEGERKTIDSVQAVLRGMKYDTLKDEVMSKLPSFNLSSIKLKEDEGKYGTILKIDDLRDNWEDVFVKEVYNDLEVLVPPKESGGFEIYVYSSLTPNQYGEVLGSVCDDFDYKLTATADELQNVTITVYRNEYDIETIPNDFFQREGMQKENYRKEDFTKGFWKKETTFSKLLDGFEGVDDINLLNNIGVFDFTFYFLKRATNSSYAARFFNKNFMSGARKDWLDKFGGIKLFRDNFRVRPYGEVKNTAFDWLGLGNRKSASPAGISKVGGGYRVEPENVAGAIKISRLTNVNFEDKSSREGLQENSTFLVFKDLLCRIINVFEEDRAYIAREMDNYDSIKFGPERDRQKAEQLKDKIIADARARKVAQLTAVNVINTQVIERVETVQQTQNDSDKELLASEIERQGEEIEKLKEEQKILRALASSGIVLASFSHDLSKQNDLLSNRTDRIHELFVDKLPTSTFEGVSDRKNPYVLLERIKKQDIKLINWLNFSLGATRKDKRQRRQLFFNKYFTNFKNDWTSVLEERGIDLDISSVEDLELRVYEIDIDSIFNNLLVNSIDAFIISKENRERKIFIKVSRNSKEINLDYHDNGPGLSKDIENPEKIFEPLFTTRRNRHTGEEEGTGLGMWIIKSIVEENDGKVQLLYPAIGFGMRVSFPEKYKRENTHV